MSTTSGRTQKQVIELANVLFGGGVSLTPRRRNTYWLFVGSCHMPYGSRDGDEKTLDELCACIVADMRTRIARYTECIRLVENAAK